MSVLWHQVNLNQGSRNISQLQPTDNAILPTYKNLHA